jgi:hypothetical protein
MSKEAMDSILELCEKGLNNGDYLTVSNNLKMIYDDLCKKQRYALIENIHIDATVPYAVQIKDKISFILLEDEQRLLIEDRMRKEEIREKQNALYQLNTMKTVLASITTEKQFLWTKYNVAKMGSDAEEARDLFVKYKECVRREKEYKLKIKDFRG